MYTIQENVRIVLSLLKQYNIRHIVVNPGGTNIPFSQAVQDDPFFKCYSIPDERSAMYFAIGLHLQTGELIATSCTSAQATRNYIPGLTEAFYKHTPILAITTAKLQRFQYQEYMQAPDQCSLPRDSVKRSFDLPPVTDDNTRIQVMHDAREAILECTHRNPGPVQLNLRIEDAVQSLFIETDLPNIEKLSRYHAWDEWNDIDLREKKILVVVGEHRPFSNRQQHALDKFCESHNAVVYVNHISNYTGKYAVQANLLLSCGWIKILLPDIVVTIGGQTGDYSVFGALNGCSGFEHWRVAEDGACVDTYGKLTRIYECPDYYFLERMTGNIDNIDHSYYLQWENANKVMNYGVELPLSNLYVAQQLYKIIPNNSIMNFAILNSLRCWNYMPLQPSILGFANVAAFGIDGCNSMLIGESMNTSELCFIVTGDIAFFYDMNALGIRHIKNNVRVLLINNDGGAEFKIMTRPWKNIVDVEQFISANGHNGSAKGWSENCGFKYLSAKDKREVENSVDVFVSPSDQPILLEVFTTKDNDSQAVALMLDKNRFNNNENAAKDLLKSMLGERGIKTIKSFFKK
jgi:2-succinyl-5-enolpyruvyl-6-hydroxy-3-cyclohexene-1-carboxylate synthase